VQGIVSITVGLETEVLTAGDAVTIPAGSIHAMKNAGKEDAQYVVVGISKGEGGKTVV
jgi:quercetin dioxygenase-like cupin family protein